MPPFRADQVGSLARPAALLEAPIVARVYHEEIADLAAAGCSYLQIDDVNFAYLCDPSVARAGAQHRRGSGQACRQTYAKLINDAIATGPRT